MDWPTIIVSAVIVAIVAAIIVCSICGKKKGKGSCGCSCSGCAMSDMCHGHQERSKK